MTFGERAASSKAHPAQPKAEGQTRHEVTGVDAHPKYASRRTFDLRFQSESLAKVALLLVHDRYRSSLTAVVFFAGDLRFLVRKGRRVEGAEHFVATPFRGRLTPQQHRDRTLWWKRNWDLGG